MSKPAAAPPTLLPLCQAENWFYVYVSPQGGKVIDRIVMWARMLDDNYPQGVVVGLLAVRHQLQRDAMCMVMTFPKRKERSCTPIATWEVDDEVVQQKRGTR